MAVIRLWYECKMIIIWKLYDCDLVDMWLKYHYNDNRYKHVTFDRFILFQLLS